MSEEVQSPVWVVTASYADDPHPHCLAVYDNEAAAKEHAKAIRDSNSPSEPVAHGYSEKTLEREPVRERGSMPDA